MVINIKKRLANGHRIVFDTLLDMNGDLFQYFGAMEKYRDEHDTWMLTDK